MTSIDMTSYSLAFEDNFTSNVLDETKWSHRYLGARKSGYTTTDAIEVNNGTLKNRIYKNELGQYCSGMISTDGKFEQNKGYFEARIKIPNIYGIQPAFWLMSNTIGSVVGDAPNSGVEIDIIEYVKTLPNTTVHTVHWDGYGVDTKNNSYKSYPQNITDGQFHIFGMEWTETEYRFYIDCVCVHIKDSYDVPISNIPQYIVLSCEIGPWGGDITTQDAYLPAYMEVDYVRAYQKI